MKHGKYVGLHQIAERHGLSYALLQNRIRYGYTLEQALSMPKHARRSTRQKLAAVGVGKALSSWGRT